MIMIIMIITIIIIIIIIMWNQAVHTGREVTAKRPDIIIKNKKEKTYNLIDVAIPADRNAVQKEVEK
jgi:predicted Holliday junction resolvase-like endonuclease